MFGSAESCCAAIYNQRDDCVPSSLDPGSDGRWVDGVMKGDPWYPSQSLSLCVNDGKQLENFIGPHQMFGSAESCCAAIYNQRDDCVPSSLDPGSDGRWVDGVIEGDPWYQHPAGHCVNDGKHKQNFIETYQMFSSADSCCDANFSFNTDCVSESMNPTNEGKWYPSGSSCTAQSPIPSWVTHAFDSEQECCQEHFEYHYDSCITGISQVQVVTLQPTPNPTPHSTPNPTRKPKKPNNTDDIEDKVTTQPTPQPTPRPTRPKPSKTGNNGDSFMDEYALTEFLFYPHYDYGDEGTSVECRIDGSAPEWITKNMMKSSKYECCTSYFPPSWTDQCNADNPYYPNFQDTSCVNDGNHPGWMVGDYLVDNMWLCCHNFFHDEELLQQCTGNRQGHVTHSGRPL